MLDRVNRNDVADMSGCWSSRRPATTVPEQDLRKAAHRRAQVINGESTQTPIARSLSDTVSLLILSARTTANMALALDEYRSATVNDELFRSSVPAEERLSVRSIDDQRITLPHLSRRD